jgi:amino acid adenylation domain-containing protein/non-ribosomal peptide synthase protein (TIGR01720 family)
VRAGGDLLSFAQRRLWFLDRLVPGSAFYTESSALRIRAPLSVPAFERALNEIVRRHEVLRTSFRLVGEEPVAVIAPSLHLPLEVVDLSDLPEHERQQRVVSLATLDARQPFNLETGPLLRTTLVRLGPAHWVFLLSIHHIVCDGWSSSVFSRELETLYSSFLAGQPSPLSELPLQYADFARWQREWLSGERLESQLGYWKRRLAGLPQLGLPTDHPRPAVFSYQGAHQRISLDGGLITALERLSQSEGATLFMGLLSGMLLLLQRYSNQDDLVVGVPVANRARRELEDLIGFFVNILLIRADLSGTPTLREVLRQVRATAVEAYAHQDLPFELVVEALHPKRDLGRNPLFQVIFQLHERPAAGAKSADAPSLVEVESATVKFDLRVDIFRSSAGDAQCVIEYSTDLFTAERVSGIGQHLRQVYEEMVRNPEQGIGDFALVGAAERDLLARWGGEPSLPQLRSTIPDRFAEQVACSPQTVAVVDGDRQLTYFELNRRAEGLAEGLLRSGLHAEECVAVSTAPRLETIVALLGILKAGGAYVPLDPSYPQERLRCMVADTRARFLVDTGDAQRFASLGMRAVALASHQKDAPASGNVRVSTTPESLAYVMYTSGSTGAPKGICVTHRGVVRLVTDASFCAMTPQHTFLWLAPLTFDATTLEIWGPLLNGGKLVIYSQERLSAEGLEQVLHHNRVTTLWLTAGLFHQLIDVHPGMFREIRQLLAGGDVLSPRHVRAHLNRVSADATFVNGYGPTENTTFTCCRVISATRGADRTVPIGSPVQRTQVYVVDRHGQLCPPGVPGELLAAGDGLARCYLNDPALTAERFVPDAFGKASGRRLYRTGDRVRYRTSGELEFLGRMDQQLKIRGFRVEPEEITAALLAHPHIENAAVVARRRGEQDKQLVAFIVPRTTCGSDEGSLQQREVEASLTEHWRELYEELYSTERADACAACDIIGWESSATGEAIPAEQMREWVECTIARILEGSPRRVLEIGCGTGLLAHRVIPECELYVGTDFSSAVVQRLRSVLAEAGYSAPRVQLKVQAADCFEGLEPGSFDIVVINSVAQYFPTVEYLLRVIDGAVAATAVGGRVFIGDVRSLPHLELLHSEVQLARAESGTACGELLRRIASAIELEHELVLHPDLFRQLAGRCKRITHVDAQCKRGSSHNELTSYRFDVALYIESSHDRASDVARLDWTADSLSSRAITEVLRHSASQLVIVSGIPNDRVHAQIRVLRALKAASPEVEAALVRNSAGVAQDVSMPALEEFWQLAEGTLFDAHIAPDADAGYCVARYVRRAAARPLAWTEESPVGAGAGRQYANNPLKSQIAAALIPQLRRNLQAVLPDYMLPSTFLVVDALPLNTNGKVDRVALENGDLERRPAVLDFVPPGDDVEKRLARIWCEALGVHRVGVHDNFFELGGDSILCIQVVARAKAVGVPLTVKQLFEHQTIAQLARLQSSSPPVHAEQGVLTGPCQLTPAQAWLFAHQGLRIDHFNQSILLEVPAGLNAAALDHALRALLEHHDGLRVRFAQQPDGHWEAHYSVWVDRPVLERHDLCAATPQKRSVALTQHCAEIQAGLNVTSGPTMRAVLYELGEGESGRLLIVVHHLLVDGVSWRILMEDLWSAYSALAAGGAAVLPAKTTSLRYWTARFAEYANAEAVQQEAKYWLGLHESPPPTLPVDRRAANNMADVRSVTAALTAEQTAALLNEIPHIFGTQIGDVLLRALARTLTGWLGTDECWFDLEGHGRETLFAEVDLSRTVGWFTSIYPVRLRSEPETDIAADLESIRTQLQSIPHRGVGFGAIRYLCRDQQLSAALARLPRRELSFNYLGQFGRSAPAGTIRAAQESPGPMRDPVGRREYLIEIDGSVTGGCLSFTWYYSAAIHDCRTVQRLAQEMMDELRAVIEYRRSIKATAAPARQFAGSGLGQDELAQLLAKLESDAGEES